MVPKKIIILLLTALLPLCVHAQEEWTIQRGDCLPTGLPKQSYANRTRLVGSHRLPTVNDQWDATKTYKQLVVLVEFTDLSFFESHDKEFYERVFNVFDESAYEGKRRYGQGSVADYYRTQSGGMLNLSFDIVGPYKVAENAKSNDSHKRAELREATEMMVADQQERDFSQYDWDNDGFVEQVVYVVAGPSGNVNGQTGYLHPNTSSFPAVTTHDGEKISNYTASTEVWLLDQNTNCGIGTICHEFTHSLGLPDIYPTNYWCYSVCDEWDLMDGGNFTNYGWCPPNFTPIEKMLLGWLTPIELTEPVSIVNLKPVSEGGEVYIADYYPIVEEPTDDEEQPSEARAAERINACVLIENRQNTLWDTGTPGSGLMIWYLDYDQSAWRNNAPNNKEGNPRFRPVYADGMDYIAWKAKIAEMGLEKNWYQNSNRMNSLYLSTSPFPFGENNAVEECQISNITINDEGYASFDFMGGASGIKDVRNEKGEKDFYDLLGRRIENPIHGQLYLVRGQKGIIRKQVY